MELQLGGTGAVQLQPARQGEGTGSTALQAVLRQPGSTGLVRAALGLGTVGRLVLLVGTGSTVQASTVGLLGLLLLVGVVRHPHTQPRGSTVLYRLHLLRWRLGQVRGRSGCRLRGRGGDKLMFCVVM